MTSPSETCRCTIHAHLERRQLDAARHACYRTLATAILGPSAPRDDLSLASALADHARLLRPASNSGQLTRAA